MTHLISRPNRYQAWLMVTICSCLSCLLGCDEKVNVADEPAPKAVCERLFGAPNENTGLTDEQCAPKCTSCEDDSAGGSSSRLSFTPAKLADDDINGLRTFELMNPPALLGENPYLNPAAYPDKPSQVCAARFEVAPVYRLETFDSKEDAEAAGAVLTHEGACGACSSLQDLAVYVAVSDLTGPVRNCALNQLGQPAEATIPCLEELGFSPACAEIWAYNTKNTRDECFSECISAIDEPYHLPNGAPNECISCDEEKSGPVFKAVSGRTRRNSGLPTALCRPCAGVARISHQYP